MANDPKVRKAVRRLTRAVHAAALAADHALKHHQAKQEARQALDNLYFQVRHLAWCAEIVGRSDRADSIVACLNREPPRPNPDRGAAYQEGWQDAIATVARQIDLGLGAIIPVKEPIRSLRQQRADGRR